MKVYRLFSISNKYPKVFRLFHCDLPEEITMTELTKDYFAEEVTHEFTIRD